MVSQQQADTFFLETPRLKFRLWTPDDLKSAMEVWGDPQVTRLFYKNPLTQEQVKARLEQEIAYAQSVGLQYWPIFEADTMEHVGCCGLRPWPRKARALELGVHLKPKYWSKGYATEAGRAAMVYGLQKSGAEVITAGHHPDNKGSRNALLKLGFLGGSMVYYDPTGLHHPWYYYYGATQPFSEGPFNLNDRKALAIVHHTAIKETFKDLIPAYVEARSLDKCEEAWEELINRRDAATRALLHGDQIVGFVAGIRSKDDDVGDNVGEIDRIYLHPSVWGKGHGTRLLQWCEDSLRKKRFSLAKLWVFEANERARRFYERHGYKPDGKTKEAFGARLLRYEKQL